jgi:hypothetical protein
MNPKYRSIYLLLGFAGLIYLVYQIIANFALFGTDGINPVSILLIAIPDMALFFLAYKTYPAESTVKRQN